MKDFAGDDEVWSASRLAGRLREALGAVLIGQDALVADVLTGVLAGGHVLLQGLPGLGKTQLVKGLARAAGLGWKRIQFTPDLLPGDVTGSPVLDEQGGHRTFVFRPGPVFANLVLADEVNRASPRTQSALLEAMQERQVTVLGETHALPEPFFVLATQNPIELEGTYPLPEAQLDRFLFRLEVRRSGADVLERIVREREMGRDPEVAAVSTPGELRSLMQVAARMHLPDVVARYVARVVDATHDAAGLARGVRYGASPRAALGLAAGARARALLHGRPGVGFEDVTTLAHAVLDHRLVLEYEAKLEGLTAAAIVDRILAAVAPQERELPALLERRP